MGNILSKLDNLLLRKTSLPQNLLQRGQKFHTDKDISTDSILMRNHGEIITADDIGLALQFLHQLIFLHIILDLAFVRCDKICPTVTFVIIGFHFIFILRAGYNFQCRLLLNPGNRSFNFIYSSVCTTAEILYDLPVPPW